MTSLAAKPVYIAPPATALPAESPFPGILLLLAAVFLFACADAASKELMAALPSIQVTWMRFAVFVALLLPILLWSGPSVLRSRRIGLQILRGLGVVLSSLLFILGLAYMPLAEATAIAFVSPLIVTALSAPLLGETVGPRRWSAVFVGLCGVMVVVRPGTDAFDPAAILPFLAAVVGAGTLVLTRRMGEQERPVATVLYTAVVGFLALSAVAPFDWATPTPRQWALGALSGLLASVAQWLIVLAYGRGSASVRAPFTYSQLVWAALLGFVAFGAVPDVPTGIGAGIIIAGGLYTAYRERLRVRD